MFLLEHLNSSPHFLEFCAEQKKGGTRTRLYFKVLKTYKMFMPIPEEQTKIATFLTQIDNVISASEEEVAKLEQLRKGIMQKIFSQEVRFKKDDGSDYKDWVEKPLAECAEGLDNMRKPITASDRVSGDVPYYGSTGIQDYIQDYLFDEELVLLSEDAGPFFTYQDDDIAQYVIGKSWVNNHAHVLCYRRQGQMTSYRKADGIGSRHSKRSFGFMLSIY